MLAHLRTSRALSYLAVALLAALATGGGWALAASGGSQIHACSAKKTGALRVAKKCKKSERTVSWNTVGPQGATGAQGSTGQPGAKGETGATGPAGPTAAFTTNDGGTPPVSASFNVSSSNVTLPTAGKLFITATTSAQIACSSFCGEYYELFVDGHPLPAGGVQTLSAPASSTTPFVMTVTGVSGPLTSGPHTIVLERDTNTGSPTITQPSGSESNISSVLIGG
jgi:hypothetical protein